MTLLFVGKDRAAPSPGIEPGLPDSLPPLQLWPPPASHRGRLGSLLPPTPISPAQPVSLSTPACLSKSGLRSSAPEPRDESAHFPRCRAPSLPHPVSASVPPSMKWVVSHAVGEVGCMLQVALLPSYWGFHRAGGSGTAWGPASSIYRHQQILKTGGCPYPRKSHRSGGWCSTGLVALRGKALPVPTSGSGVWHPGGLCRPLHQVPSLLGAADGRERGAARYRTYLWPWHVHCCSMVLCPDCSQGGYLDTCCCDPMSQSSVCPPGVWCTCRMHHNTPSSCLSWLEGAPPHRTGLTSLPKEWEQEPRCSGH